MDGVHDMGGMDGYGKVVPEPDEPVFHEPWEGRVMAMNRAMGTTGTWTIDRARFFRESLPPPVYVSASYYQKWFLGLREMLLEHGLIDTDEIVAGRSLRAGKALARGPFTAADLPRVMTRGRFGRPPQAVARFAIGDRVRARNIHPMGHTRLPRYVRGHTGTIELIPGAHVYPDTAAAGQGEHPQWLYTVVFDSRELWGEDADPTVTVSIDAFEPYLEAV
ncbi:MAG TPA: nitrile hydratase subunit beta [Burkholderiaceae bacterium]|jgi:nitrile hydratase|nr:nitrile hydratase subunit beta [Burkholderiaceae bacterium]